MKKLGLLEILFIISSILFRLNCVNATDYGSHPGETYCFIGSVEHEMYDLYYGSTKNIETSNHDGLVVMISKETDTRYRTLIMSDTGNESVQSIALFSDGSFVVVLVKYEFDYTSLTYLFSETQFIHFDVYGNEIKTKSIKQKFLFVTNIDYLLVLSEDNRYQADLVLNDHFDTISLSNQLEVFEPLKYQFRGNATVNDQTVDEIELTDPGYYHIEINDFLFHWQVDVTVHPTVVGVIDQMSYFEPVVIEANGTLYLDEELYTSSTSINTIGYHTLSIQGVNGYESEIQFVIEPLMGDLVDGGSYHERVDIIIEGAILRLNDELITSPMFVAQPGGYHLTIEGVNGYEKKISFILYPSIKNLKEGAILSVGDPINFIGEGKLNQEWINPGYILSETGDYTFELYFGDSVYETLHFQVIESDESSIPNKTSFPYLQVILGAVTLLGIYLVFRKK